MLRVDNIWARASPRPFGRTTFSVGGGEVIIVQADSQMERTSWAYPHRPFALSGGEIYWSAGDEEPQPISMKLRPHQRHYRFLM